MTPDPEFEDRVGRFERAWLLRTPRPIEEFLDGPFATPSPRRSRLLVELICVEMEFRGRISGEIGPSALGRYLERFPELGTLDRLPLDLIGEAYRARRLWGDRPSHAEFASAFRERAEAILAELARVDAEIDEEAAGPVPEPVARAIEPAGVAEDEASGVPWLSHRDFLLRRLIGAGRMGKVYEASRPGDGGVAAVKYLRKGLLRRPEVVRRFLDEARTIAGLRHPNVVGLHGLGRTDAGSYFFAMDLVDGPDLARLAGGRPVAEGPTIGWTMQACEALEHAHERGVVHCDLKPANILLDGGGRIRVTDFGLARSLAGEAPWAAEIEGTAPFMAPEQASRAWGGIGPWTDVYGLGAVLFALLTGRPPFVGARLPDVLAGVVSGRPVVSPAELRPGLSPPLVEVCLRCLAKPPGARFRAVREVREALAAVRDRV